MAKSAKLKSTVERRGRPRKRAEQQRSLETRGAILDAAIAEFAERGFEGASIRAIADRLGLQHPLITYTIAARVYSCAPPPSIPSHRSRQGGIGPRPETPIWPRLPQFGRDNATPF